PSSRARRREDDYLGRRFENFFHALEHFVCETAELRAAVIDCGTRDGVQYAIRHVGGSGNLEQLPTSGISHSVPASFYLTRAIHFPCYFVGGIQLRIRVIGELEASSRIVLMRKRPSVVTSYSCATFTSVPPP